MLVAGIIGLGVKAGFNLISGDIQNRNYQKRLGISKQISDDEFASKRREDDALIGASGFEKSGGKLESGNVLTRLQNQSDANFKALSKASKQNFQLGFFGSLAGGVAKGLKDSDYFKQKDKEE